MLITFLLVGSKVEILRVEKVSWQDKKTEICPQLSVVLTPGSGCRPDCLALKSGWCKLVSDLLRVVCRSPLNYRLNLERTSFETLDNYLNSYIFSNIL